MNDNELKDTISQQIMVLMMHSKVSRPQCLAILISLLCELLKHIPSEVTREFYRESCISMLKEGVISEDRKAELLRGLTQGNN